MGDYSSDLYVRSDRENSSRQLNIPDRLAYTVLLAMHWLTESIKAAAHLLEVNPPITCHANKTVAESIPT